MSVKARGHRLLREFSTPTLVVLVALASLLCVGVVTRYGFTATGIAYAFFVVTGTWLSAIDLRLRILPNRIVVPSIGLGLLLLGVAVVVDRASASSAASAAAGAGASAAASAAAGTAASAAPGFTGADVAADAIRVVLGGLVLFVLYLVLALISPRGLGMGDVKFAAFVGIYLAFDGWDTLVKGAAAGFALAAVIGAGLIAFRRVGRGATIPFGPLMFGGAVLVLAL
ncbi:leader peptidase (prepilin peptidase)/N-methyltransferase [Glaciihabitans tibetensis]|uniref:Leader peptidase (Prepilin peptidase)/N-methyltransferase n=1 Tax=Glaciihabitans tibetensis TaxID=1266600 RepID=A0A2T0VBD2_9MICO|nr:prepilin peptidase [Glaciihabitans tibetensis]PRY67502.1 leader peptidase (prepilin peptidase)/N-methyltransferase [Glaciihabitans tibetensis]